MGERAGIRAVAAEAGVSVATVSRALNAPDRVSDELRRRVEEAAARLGYLAHGAARALASRRSFVMGAVMPTLDNPVFSACIEAFERRLDAGGYSLLVASAGYDAAREVRAIRTLLERGVDGVMLVGADHPDATWSLLRPDLPTVLTWTHRPPRPDLPCVGFDNAAAMGRIVGHLLSLGHRRFAMVAGRTAGNDRAAARLRGAREALLAAGLSLPADRVTERAYTVAEGRAAAAALLALEPRPTALLCGNDHLAFGALAAAREAGLDVPRDVSVAGFDDLDFPAYAAPPLTTVQAPAASMGTRAAEVLLDLTRGGAGVGVALELDAPLVARGSTGPARD